MTTSLTCGKACAAKRLAEDNTTLAHLSTTDPLTGIANRRAFARELSEFWEASLGGRHFAVMLIDVDYFKLFNDHYGHGAGDTCLREVSALLAKTAAGSGAFVSRYGGEEFAVLMHTSDPDEAYGVAERFRRSIAGEGPDSRKPERSPRLRQRQHRRGDELRPRRHGRSAGRSGRHGSLRGKGTGRNRTCHSGKNGNGEGGPTRYVAAAQWSATEKQPVAKTG